MPNIVKGSKQRKMVVVPYRPYRRALFTTALVLGVTISIFGGFIFGYYEAVLKQETALVNTKELGNDLAAGKREISDLRRQITILDRSSVMDQRANEEVQKTISELKQQVAQLEQDIVYYRQVVTDETIGTGLIVSQFDIYATSEADRYRYKLVIQQQDADGDSYLIGHVNVNFIGGQDDEQVVLSLREISEEQDQLDISLRFKYFQNIEGELELPSGFKPERVQIAALSIEPVVKSINQDFAWIVEGE